MRVSGDHKGYYQTLGLRRDATSEEIRTAYRAKAKVIHPDLSADTPDDFQRLSEAYETLRDPRRRLQYDAAELSADRDPQARETAESRQRGTRPHRVAVDTLGRRFLGGQAWTAAAIVLAVLLAATGGIMWRMAGQLDDRQAAMADLQARYDALAATEGELRARYRAQSVASIEDALAKTDPAQAQGRAVFATEIAFPEGSAHIDRDLELKVDNAVVELSRALRLVPENEEWLVVVDSYASHAAMADGVAVPAWETALLRLGAVIDRLLAQGLPAERIATRFQAGFTPGRNGADVPSLELRLVCCFR